MYGTPANTPISGDVAEAIKSALPDSLTLCEPWFGHESLILSPGRLYFKVHVVNDPGQGLVKLFEMCRVDKAGTREAIARDDAQASCPIFSGRSAFLRSSGDVSAGVAAFRACAGNLGIDPLAAMASDAAFAGAITAVHEKLVAVLVENMPIPEFVTRFDRKYTAFFIPGLQLGITMALNALGPAIAGLHGHLIIEARDAAEVQDAIASHARTATLEFAGTISGRPAHAGRQSCFVIIKRAA
ncbi:MAG: hypothetical protein JW839_16250 [Candidatus Lokiarchaeota archaeon]|nr:hypothetical protein [Candidatus Lokiarchaeota archaeon]